MWYAKKIEKEQGSICIWEGLGWENGRWNGVIIVKSQK